MAPSCRVRHATWRLVCATWLLLLATAVPAHADGILEAISGNEELFYNVFTSETTDESGTTKIETNTYGSRTNLRLNYNLLPTLNLNAGTTYDKTFSLFTGDDDETETEITRFRPYIWLNFRDPIFHASGGYDLASESTSSDDFDLTLNRETWNANFSWRPVDLPWTQFRYTRTATWDDDRELVDTVQDQFFLKSEYAYRGLHAYYAGNYLQTEENLADQSSTVLSHEAKVLYSTTFLDGRISLTTDNRMRWTELTTDRGIVGLAGLDSIVTLAVPAREGLSSLDDTPEDTRLDPMESNPGLIDLVRDVSAGINIGARPARGGDIRLRTFGLDLGTPVAVNTLRVWVDGFRAGPLPGDIASFFDWRVYTSPDRVTWTLHATVPAAPFGPFDRRFTLTFPAVTTRYIKVVTRGLPVGPVGATPTDPDFLDIFVTELEAFADTVTAGSGRDRRTQTARTHNFELKAILFTTPFLYYRFAGDYIEFDPDGDPRYTVSNGLFLNHRFNPWLSTAANASYEFGRDRDEDRTAVLYYAALTATPLPTLTDSLVFSGNQEWLGDATITTNSVVLYNTAQLYRGIDATLNMGAIFSSDEEGDRSIRRRELFLNLGTGIVPHPDLTLSAYYFGKLTHTSADAGDEAAGDTATSGDTDHTEHRLDLAVSFTPFRTLLLSAVTNIVAETDRDLSVTQNYGLSWSPFPDGSLQLSFFYSENRLPDETVARIIQPTVRWYMGPRRRSYVEGTYQRTFSDSPTTRTESELFSTSLNLYF
jgi:hypothetical protein